MAAHARISKSQITCRHCGRHVDECGRLTWVGQCLDCAEQRMTQNIRELRHREGDSWAKWRSGMLRAALTR